MSEIVTLQLGGCGVALGYRFWEDVCDEHGIIPTGNWCGEHALQTAKINCLFHHGPVANYIPRAILVDIDSTSLDVYRSYPFGRIFHPDNMIYSTDGSGTGTGNNYARGYYTLAPYIMEQIEDRLRLEAERCDWLAGFQMINAIGGGSGSSLQSMMLPWLQSIYPKKVRTNFVVTPSAKLSDTVVEPYNAMLSFPSLVDCSDLTICLDNESLYNISSKVLKLTRPTYDDINLLSAKVISGMSATYRFPARNHCSWQVLRCLAPSPTLHFFVPGFVPLASRAAQPFTSVTVDTVTQQMLSGQVLMAPLNKSGGKYLSAAALFRGCSVGDLNVNELLCRYEQKYASDFVDWMPYHFMKGICVTPPRGLRVSATFLANHTSSAAIWGNVHDRFRKLYKKKAFLHWFTGEGMSADDFAHAEDKMRSLIKEYKDAEKNAPPDWKSPEDNPVFKKLLEEEKTKRVVDIVTIQPKFTILKLFRRSLNCVQILGLEPPDCC